MRVLFAVVLLLAASGTSTFAQEDPCNHHGTDHCKIVYAEIGDFKCAPQPVRVLDEKPGFEHGALLMCIEEYGVAHGEMYYGSRRPDGSDVGFSKSLSDVHIVRVESVR